MRAHPPTRTAHSWALPTRISATCTRQTPHPVPCLTVCKSSGTRRPCSHEPPGLLRPRFLHAHLCLSQRLSPGLPKNLAALPFQTGPTSYGQGLQISPGGRGEGRGKGCEFWGRGWDSLPALVQEVAGPRPQVPEAGQPHVPPHGPSSPHPCKVLGTLGGRGLVCRGTRGGTFPGRHS